MERRSVLENIVKPGGGIQLGSFVEGEGKSLFDLTKAKGMEGMVAKRKESAYRPGKRSSDWLKIKSRPQQEFVVGGFTEGKGSRKHLGALLLGAYRNGRLHYFGHSGSRFSEKGLRDALQRMKPLFTNKSPFENPPRLPERIQWVKSELVCEISFAEWTQDGELCS
jgi:bifunctional non-homologous end joining protein LigD